MGNVNMEASQINYRGGESKMSVEQAIKEAGSYTLPTASADTLGGVKVGSGLSIADGVLSADGQLPEDPETDGVKVLTATTSSGETIHSWEDPESGVVDYSTNEVDTGIKWIDGKTIYRKVVEFGALPANTSKTVSSGLTNETIVNMRGIAINSTDGIETVLPCPTSNNKNGQLYYDLNNHNIVVATADDYSAYTAYIVLEYTKTTT